MQQENLDHQEISDSITTCFEDKEWIMNYIIYFIDQELMGEFGKDIDSVLAKHITRIGITNDGSNSNTKEILITENDTDQQIKGFINNILYETIRNPTDDYTGNFYFDVKSSTASEDLPGMG
jgi:hypothetical protein